MTQVIRKCFNLNGDNESNLLQFENRILYEFILRLDCYNCKFIKKKLFSSHRAGVCTIAIDRDEEIIGIVINRIVRYHNRCLPEPNADNSESKHTPNSFVDQIKDQLYNSVSSVHTGSSNLIETFSQIDWRKESISSIVRDRDDIRCIYMI